jgi:hypothetical protein
VIKPRRDQSVVTKPGISDTSKANILIFGYPVGPTMAPAMDDSKLVSPNLRVH